MSKDSHVRPANAPVRAMDVGFVAAAVAFAATFAALIPVIHALEALVTWQGVPDTPEPGGARLSHPDHRLTPPLPLFGIVALVAAAEAYLIASRRLDPG